MMSPLAPPGTTDAVHARRALVVAPHYDDEVLGCGGLLAQLSAAGTALQALYLSDGSGGVEAVDDRPAYAAARRREAAAAAAVLGIDHSEHLALPDGALDQHLETIAGALERALANQPPDLLLVPSPLEVSADHRAAFRALHQVLGAVRDGAALYAAAAGLTVLAYEVNHPQYPDLLVDVGDQLGTVEQAMACYPSQQARHRYLEAGIGLRRYRAHSLPSAVEAAEGYRRLTLADFVSHSPAGLIRRLGGAPALLAVAGGPRVSVVVRTKDRPALLAEALDSLAASSYRRAEIVLVNDGGERPEHGEHPLPIVDVELPATRGRAAAANAGVAAASGDAVAFLDDDDLAEPEHLATLVGVLGGAGVRVAYSDAAVGVYRLDGSGAWACRERRLPYSRDFDADHLLFDNYIPFNTVLIERRLFDQVGPFDEALPFFEDWDWLIRCTALTPFHHLARVTCEYRQFHGGGHQVLGDRPRARADFLTMKARVVAKHAGRLTPEAAVAVADRLRAEAIAAGDEAARQRAAAAAAEARHHRLNGRLAALDAERRVEQVSAQRLEAERDRQRQELMRQGAELARRDAELARLYRREQELLAGVEDQGGKLAATYAEIERLNGHIREMEATRAWRLHQWWQRRRR